MMREGICLILIHIVVYMDEARVATPAQIPRTWTWLRWLCEWLVRRAYEPLESLAVSGIVSPNWAAHGQRV